MDRFLYAYAAERSNFNRETMIYLTRHGLSFINPYVVFHADGFTISGVVGASTLAVLSCLGFDGISTIAEETTIAPKKVGHAIITAIIIQATCLCLLAYVSSLLFPDYTKILHPDTINVDLQSMVGGQAYSFIMVTITQFFCLATACTCITSASRLLFSMGRDEVIPKRIFSHVGEKFQTPIWNIVILSVICYAGAYIFDWNFIADIVAFGAMIAFMGVNLSVIAHYFIKMKERKVISNLILPLLGFFGILYVLINAGASCKIVGFTWLGRGVLYLVIRYSTSQKFRDTINRGNLEM